MNFAIKGTAKEIKAQMCVPLLRMSIFFRTFAAAFREKAQLNIMCKIYK